MGFRQREGDQPLPVGNDLPHIHDQVCADLQERKALGLSRYGQALQAFNGRKAMQDAYEEILDATAYFKQLLEESQVFDTSTLSPKTTLLYHEGKRYKLVTLGTGDKEVELTFVRDRS